MTQKANQNLATVHNVSEIKTNPPVQSVRELMAFSGKLEHMLDLFYSLLTNNGPEDVLGKVMAKLADLVESELATLFLLDSARGELWSQVTLDGSEIRLNSNQGIAGYVLQTGTSVNLADVREHPAFDASFDAKFGLTTLSMLCVPLRDISGECIGAIEIINKRTAPAFNASDRKVLESFSAILSIVMHQENAVAELRSQRAMLESEVAERTRSLEEAKDRADQLLFNVLPDSVATELIEKGRVEPMLYEAATIMFVDIIGFTKTASNMDPWDLVNELDCVFEQFDLICEKHNIEKLKTIGDGYMCAGGLPEITFTHAIDMALAALDIQRLMLQVDAIRMRFDQSEFWQIRCGFHTGPVMAGVIGRRKLAYDVWGDAVNIAARMESSADANSINISKDTYELIKDYFLCEKRGAIEVKNRGLVEMYYLTGIHPELSEDGLGLLPNDEFKRRYELLRTKGQYST